MNSISKRSDFSYLSKNGIRKRTRMLTLIRANSPKYSFLLSCVVASKRSVGKAVDRNRAKRRIRELIRKYSYLLKPGDLLMVIATKAVCTALYKELDQEFLYALKRVISGKTNDCNRH